MPVLKLTPQNVEASTCPEGVRKVVLFDASCKGLFLEVRASGGRTYYLRYTDGRARTRQLKLGDAKDLTLTQARQMADKFRNQIAMGIDPIDGKAELKQIATVGEFIQNHYLPFVESYKKSWECDRGLLRKHIEPIWGRRYLDQITKADVVGLMARHRLTHAPGSCNRLLILLRYLFSLPKKWDMPGIEKNPATDVPLLKEENFKERFLTPEEAQRLYAECKVSDNPMLQFIIPMLILTGARKREVLDSRWEDFDFDRRLWRIHTTKLGQPRFVPMSDGVISLLESVPRFQCTWVFPNPKTLKPYVSIFFSWSTARRDAGLPDVRIHDLRHSYASFLVNSGRSLYEVQRLLGHTQIKTTQRYAHLSHDTLLDASNAATKAVSGMMLPIMASRPAASVAVIKTV